MEDLYANIIFPTEVVVTDQVIDLSSLSEKQKSFYIDLFKKIIELYLNQGENRYTIGLAGPTGSGKSVITAILKNLAAQIDKRFAFEVLTIDAFHYTNDVLSSKVTREGELLKEHKGRYDTYDVEKLEKALNLFRRGESLSLPTYSRILHNPIEDSIQIENGRALLIVEGLWLFYKKCGWEKIYKYFDYTIFVTADKAQVKDAVLKRHKEGGKTVAEAEAHYANVDALNSDLVAETGTKAKLTILPYYEI